METNKKNNGQPKAALYIRVSSREQFLDGYSLDAQERVLREYCGLHLYTVYDLYKDEGISAKDIKHRPGVMQLLADAKERKFEIILVWKLTRFSRSLANLVAVCEELDTCGVSLVSCSEAFDCTTPAGRMIRNMLGTVAQFEREVISENVILGMAERAQQGKPTCTCILGYDYDKETGSLTINPEEAEQVRYIYRTYLQLKDIAEVAKVCKEKGYRGKNGGAPKPESIHKILTHVRYCGYNTYHGEICPGRFPVIIEPDIFRRVQSLIKRQGKTVGRRRIKDLPSLPNGTQPQDHS